MKGERGRNVFEDAKNEDPDKEEVIGLVRYKKYKNCHLTTEEG